MTKYPYRGTSICIQEDASQNSSKFNWSVTVIDEKVDSGDADTFVNAIMAADAAADDFISTGLN